MHSGRLVVRFVLVAALTGSGAGAHAATRTWIGGDDDWDASDGNWSSGDEPDPDDSAFFNTPVSVDLANANEEINGLSMVGGAALDLNGNDLTVNGQLAIANFGTTLSVGPVGSVLRADNVTVNGSATLAMRGGALTVNDASGDGFLDLNLGGTVNGNGVISFTDGVAAGVRVLINDGTLNATFAGQPDIAGSAAGTFEINASDGDARVDLDGDAGNGMVVVSRNDTLDVNVPLSNQTFAGTITLRSGATLDMSSAWSLANGDIVVDTVGLSPGSAGNAATIAGGTMTVNNGTIALDAIDSLRIAAPINAVSGTITVDGGALYLDGGGTVAAGVNLVVQNGALLQGQGMIDAPFQGNNLMDTVLADNGILVIADASFINIGTADSDGRLFLPYSWNSNDFFSVKLNGGELRAFGITNDRPNGIRGNGLISSGFVNNSRIVAEGGGTLVLDDPFNDNDWDGVADTGVLEASTADMELHDEFSVFFQGVMRIREGRRIVTSGFGLNMGTNSTLDLRNGAQLNSESDGQSLSGMLFVSGGQATLTAMLTSFEATSTTVLGGDLLLANGRTRISPGAEFSGGGALINTAGKALRLIDGLSSSDLAVMVTNRGTLELEDTPLTLHTAAQVQGSDYEQTASGFWQFDIGGVGPTAFDRLTLAGTAALGGTLDLTLIDGFAPSLGQTFDFLSATGGVSGSFAVVDQPAGLPPGLKFAVAYLPTLVQLQVVSAPIFEADFDDDADVDGFDFLTWQRRFGGPGDASQGDANGDGMVTGADFAIWKQEFGETTDAAAVAEPGAAVLVMGAALVAIGARRRE